MGGQAVVVDSMARQFLAMGHEVAVLAPRPHRCVALNDELLPYPVLRHPRFYSKRWFLDGYRWWVASAYRRHRFDVLHCHSVYPAGYVAARCAMLSHVPLVVTSLGDVSSQRLARQAGPSERYRLMLRRADAAIAISQFIEHRYRELCPEVRRVERISLGVDSSLYAATAARPAGLPGSIRPGGYLLFVGRLVAQKGVDLLLDAIAQAAVREPLCLAVAGDGSARHELEARAKALGIAEQVHFLGAVEESVKIYLYQNALCTVMPSRNSEGFPLVALESCAAGRAVLGTDIPGLREAVVAEQTGLLVPPESVEALARAISRMLADRQWLERAGAEARRFAAGYAWDQVARRHLAVYEELCRNARRAA
ncbi:MAG: glycosyltransferase family 4 protein [Pirellulales bacterium]|nr:glycosyltransferase family 4 protein [Pirellulales bacterium]